MKCPNHPSNDVSNHYLIKVNNTGKQIYVGTCCSSCANEISNSLVTNTGKYTLKDEKYLMKNGKKVQQLRHKSKTRKLIKGKPKSRKSTVGKSKKRKSSKKTKIGKSKKRKSSKKLKVGKSKKIKSNKMVGGVNVGNLLDENIVSDEIFKDFIDAFIDKNTKYINALDFNNKKTIELSFDSNCHKLETTEINKNYCDLLFINIYMYLKNKSESNENENVIFNKDTYTITIHNTSTMLNELNSEISDKLPILLQLQDQGKSEGYNVKGMIDMIEKEMKNTINTNPNNIKLSRAVESENLINRFFKLYLELLRYKISNNNNKSIQTGGTLGLILGPIIVVVILYALYKTGEKNRKYFK